MYLRVRVNAFIVYLKKGSFQPFTHYRAAHFPLVLEIRMKATLYINTCVVMYCTITWVTGEDRIIWIQDGDFPVSLFILEDTLHFYTTSKYAHQIQGIHF